jgi:quercetin dioxygenase-like cupin family protein
VRMLVTDLVVTDTITITRVRADPETVRLEAGAELRWEAHDADHHIVVVVGSCRVLGRQVRAGGSAYIPAGIDHTVKAGAWGCTLFSVDSTHEVI